MYWPLFLPNICVGLIVILSLSKCDLAATTEGLLMCYQGTIVTTKNNRIPLDKDSLKDFGLSSCGSADTTTTAIHTTTVITSAPNITIPTATDMKVTTTHQAVTPSIAPESTTQQVNTTSAYLNATTAPQIISTVSQNPAANSTQNDMGEHFIKRRDVTDGEGISGHAQFSCEIFSALSNQASSKLMVNSTYTLKFGCSIDDQCQGVEDGAVLKNIMRNGVNGTLYCCKKSRCNNPMLITKNDPSIQFQTVEKCNRYTSSGIASYPCSDKTHMCITETKNGTTVLSCGKKKEVKYCMKDGWIQNGCGLYDSTNICCCAKDNCNNVVAEPSTEPMTTTKTDTRGGKTWVEVLLIMVAFLIGIFSGCFILVCMRRRCKAKTTDMDLTNFSYSKFQSADDGSDNIL